MFVVDPYFCAKKLTVMVIGIVEDSHDRNRPFPTCNIYSYIYPRILDI